MEENNLTMSITKRCIIAVLCERTSLFILVTGYTLLGAIIFKTIEGGENHNVPVDFKKSREDCLKELWVITERLNVLYERNWTRLVTEQLKRFEKSILESGRNEDSLNVSRTPWTFGSALLYSITLLTTVGYSKLSPKTVVGKISAMLYAIIGVPLMLILLSTLGGCLARGARSGYSKMCCYGKAQGVKRSASSVGYHKAPTSPTGKFHNRSHEDSAAIQIAFPSGTTPSHSHLRPAPVHIGHQAGQRRAPLATVRSSHARGGVKRAMDETAPCRAHHEASARSVAAHSTLAELDDAEDTDNELVVCPSHDTPSRAPLLWRPPEPPHRRPPTFPALLVLAVFVAYVCAGAALLCSAGDSGVGFLDAVYVCFAALATIGVGGQLPQRDAQLVACCVYVFVGLVVVAMCLCLVDEEVAARCRPVRR